MTGSDKNIKKSLLRIAVTFFVISFFAITLAPETTLAAKKSEAVNILPDQEKDPNEFAGDISDPLEPFNRLMFGINDVLDTLVFRPVAVVYRTVVPQFARTGIRNIAFNIATPITLTNDLLQGEWDRAQVTLSRFVVNSTVGIGGLIDVAEQGGQPAHFEDFGQTLATWGVGQGPYIVLPIIGPSSPRHLVGRVADIFTNPWTWILWNEPIEHRLAPTGATLLIVREQNLDNIDNLKETSPDYYASIRSFYAQNRSSEISNNSLEEDLDSLPPIPD